MGCFPVDFQEAKRPIKTKSGKHPIKVRKRPIKEGKRPIKAMVLVGSSVGCSMGCFQAPPPWRKKAPLKRPIKRSMIVAPSSKFSDLMPPVPLPAVQNQRPTTPEFLTKDFCLQPGLGRGKVFPLVVPSFWRTSGELFRSKPCSNPSFCWESLNGGLANGGLRHFCPQLSTILEAQQRYFSYRAILAAIVSQNCFVLAFMGYRTIIARYVARWGIAQMFLCEMKYQGGYRTILGSANLPYKVSRDMGYRSDSIAISRDRGPLIVHDCRHFVRRKFPLDLERAKGP